MDISSLRERSRDTAYTVSELNNFIKNLLDGTRALASVTVKGEISNLKRHTSGHFYFSLKDSEGQIKAVMFSSRAASLRFMPENGMKVIAHGQISVYVRDGAYQLYVGSLQPDGVGALYLAYEQLKEKLSLEGLFDEFHKKPIPRYPRRIGVITSPTGAAVRDIINVLGRRYPLADIYIYPALVQGDGAEATLISGIDYFDKSKLADVVIIGRGGGSIEDLWAFNSERLARRIFAANVPVISAVGHETDFTICDFVSDLRAPTPSAAAELAVPDIRQLMQQIDIISDRVSRAPLTFLDKMKERLLRVTERDYIRDGELLLEERREMLCERADRISLAASQKIKDERSRFALLSGKLSALNPLSVLSRGYSVTLLPEGEGYRTVGSVDSVSIGDAIRIRLSDGSLYASVDRIDKTEDEK